MCAPIVKPRRPATGARARSTRLLATALISKTVATVATTATAAAARPSRRRRPAVSESLKKGCTMSVVVSTIGRRPDSSGNATVVRLRSLSPTPRAVAVAKRVSSERLSARFFSSAATTAKSYQRARAGSIRKTDRRRRRPSGRAQLGSRTGGGDDDDECGDGGERGGGGGGERGTTKKLETDERKLRERLFTNDR